MGSDSSEEIFDLLHMANNIPSQQASIMVQGNQELADKKFLLNPCAEPFLPRRGLENSLLNPHAKPFFPINKDLENSTRPTVLKNTLTNTVDPHISLSAPQNSGQILQLDNNMDPKEMLECLKTKHRDRPIIAHLNINFLDPKFEPLKDIIKDKVDILLVSETKIDESFPEGRFFIEGYKEPIRLDRNKNGGGLLFFIHDDLECKEISHKLPKKNRRNILKTYHKKHQMVNNGRL